MSGRGMEAFLAFDITLFYFEWKGKPLEVFEQKREMTW